MGHGPRRHQSGLRPNKGVDLAHRHAMSLIHTKVHPLHLHPWMKSGSPLICPSRLHMDHEGEMRCDKHFHVQDEATNSGTNISSTWRPHLAGKVGSADPQVGRPTYPLCPIDVSSCLPHCPRDYYIHPLILWWFIQGLRGMITWINDMAVE